MKDKGFANDKDPLDELFAKEFDHSEIPPNQQNWDHIREGLDQKHFDQVFKQRFEDFERRPSEKIWNEVATHLPLNLRLRNQLQWLSKIAAVLVLGMFAFYLFDQNPAQSNLADLPIEMPSHSQEIEIASTNPPETKEAFVFDIPAAKTSKKARRNPAHQTSKELEEADDFLASILLDEDEFGDQINELKMAQILLPIEPLPVENLAAMLVPVTAQIAKEQNIKITKQVKKESVKTTSKEMDLQIKIPLKVVEESEIEALINYYDQQMQKKN